jgi:hypothetical protein
MAAFLTQEAERPVLVDDSRYVQLCEALSRARAERVARRDECFAFIERFIQGLIQYLKIPLDLVRLAPPSGESSPNDAPLTVGAASMLGEDGYWQTGLQLKIGGQTPGAVAVVVALVLHIKKKDRNFLFKLMPDGPAIKISDAPGADASHAHDFVFQQLLDSLRGPP